MKDIFYFKKQNLYNPLYFAYEKSPLANKEAYKSFVKKTFSPMLGLSLNWNFLIN